ncbi:hypothetical protein AB1Y20_005120 [Prymnesium parvum]|uniref:Uncharacterized protein n=1 Tax=Prymnesium parvum TaxID=97485 RepID=A0AB34J5A1_PRYPA
MSAPALAPKLTYAQVVAGVSASARFTARAAHDLHYQDSVAHDRLTGWVAEIQTDVSGPQPTIPWPSLGELVLPHVRLAEDAREKGYGEVYIVEEAWERWHDAMLSLRGTETHLAAMGVMYLEAEKALASAPDEVKDALVLREADLELVQADVRLDETAGTAAAKAAAQAHNKALDKRVWLHDLQLRQLAGPDGKLGSMARLSSAIGSHVTRASREAASFNKNNALLRATVSAKEGIPEDALDDEDVALGVCQLLASAATPPMLLPQPRPPGGTEMRSHWREAAAAWKAGATCSEARLASMLAAHTATAAATIDSVAALLGVDKAGKGLVGDQVRAYQALATVAQRLQIVGSAAPFGPAALVELGDRMAHLTDMLSAPPWSDKMLSERCDFVVATLQTARRNEERATHSTSVGGSSTTEAGSKLGAGTIPKHFQPWSLRKRFETACNGKDVGYS